MTTGQMGACKIGVSPDTFARAFSRVTSKNATAIVQSWDHCTEFTPTMLALLPHIAAELELSVYAGEYYTLDAVFYKDKDLDYFNADQTYAKCIAVAYEHENAWKGTAVEMNKLQLFNAPLKVLEHPKSRRSAYGAC